MKKDWYKNNKYPSQGGGQSPDSPTHPIPHWSDKSPTSAPKSHLRPPNGNPTCIPYSPLIDAPPSYTAAERRLTKKGSLSTVYTLRTVLPHRSYNRAPTSSPPLHP